MRRVQSVILLLAVTLVAVCQSSRSASADVMAYASTNQGDFGRINLTTGQYTSIGSLGLPSTTIYGMGFIGVTLYGADDDSLAAGFYSIDTTTGLATSITTLGDTVYGGTTGFGAFYAVDSYSPGLLFAVDTSGNFLGLSPLAFTADGLVAFGPGPNLYVSGIGGPNDDELYTITPGGDVLDLGSLGAFAYSGIIVGDTLYSTDGTNIYTYTVSPTGVSAILSTTAVSGLSFGDGLASLAAVPEPSSMLLAVIGSAGVGLVSTRRGRRNSHPNRV